jgi:hypothetical protein
MPAVALAPVPLFGFGNPDVGSKLLTYAAGTLTPLATYTDSTGNVANGNPVVMSSQGLASVWLATGVGYKLTLNSAADVLIWSVDNINIPSAAASGSTLPAPAVFTMLTGTLDASAYNGQAEIPLAGFFSANQRVMMVKVEVTEQFGASNGLASLALGDAVNTDIYGSGMTLTTGVKPKGVGRQEPYTTSTSLSLFAQGGPFDTTGAASVWALVLTMP